MYCSGREAQKQVETVADVFISYASPDRERARVLASGLEEQGWSVWWDLDNQPGRLFDEAIEEALSSASSVIVLWSNASVKSDWVKAEAGEAAEKRLLVPALIERVKIPLRFRQFQAADLTGWTGATDDVEFCKLLASVARLLGRSVRVAGPPLRMPREPGQKQSSDARWRLTVAALAVLVVAVAILGWMSRTRVDVPSVVGQSLNQAKGSIAAAKLTPGKVTHEPSTESALGTVLRQVPEPGATATRGTAVALVVAAAPPEVGRKDPPLTSSVRPTPSGIRVSRPCSTRRISACRSSSLTSRPFMHFFLAQRSLVVW